MMVDHRASPWESDWPALVESYDPQLSIVMLGGWDLAWIEQHGVEAYAQVVLHTVDVLSARVARCCGSRCCPAATAPRSP